MDLRESRRIPERLDSPRALESFLDSLARELAPGLEGSVTRVEWREGERTGTDWALEGHLEDGTLFVLVARPSDGSLTLLLDDAPNLKPALPGVGRWTYLGIGGVLTAGFAARAWTESALWGTLVSLSVLAAWVTLEIHLKRRKERAARSRPLDVERWRERFDRAIALAAREAE